MDERLAEKMRRRFDEIALAALRGTSCVTTTDSAAEPFTLDKMMADWKAAMASIPPPPVFASSVDYPSDGFWTFDDEGREYVIGHPSLWAKVPASTMRSSSVPFGGIQIIDADHPSQGELRAKIRFRIATASHRPGEPQKWPKDVSVPMRPVPIYG